MFTHRHVVYFWHSPAFVSDELSWLLTMSVILWRGWRTVSLMQLTWLQAFSLPVQRRCNLKTTPGPQGDAKTVPCQSTGTPTKWIKEDYSGLSWPWGDVCSGFCMQENNVNTAFCYRETVKCGIYVNPSGEGMKRGKKTGRWAGSKWTLELTSQWNDTWKRIESWWVQTETETDRQTDRQT